MSNSPLGAPAPEAIACVDAPVRRRAAGCARPPRPSARAAAGLLAISLCGFAVVASADDADDRAREDMQQRLNQEVLSAPFSPGDIGRAEAYAKEAQKSGIPPVAHPPRYWAPGWTCGNLTGYAYYNYGDYRNCVYYHHYYGRYWR